MLRLLCAFIGTFLLTGLVQAEGASNPSPAILHTANTDNATGNPITLTPEKIQSPVTPLPTEAEKLHMWQIQQAASELALLRATLKATTADKGFLSSLFSTKINPIDIDLLTEMESYINRFSYLDETAEIYHLKAQVYQRIDNYPAAALNWLMILTIYPNSPFITEAQKGLKELSDNKLKKQASVIKVMTESIGSLGGDQDHRVAAFLIFLGSLREPDFAAPISAECAAFLLRNRTYSEEDRIEHALAHQKMLFSSDVAIYHFNKLLALYPNSTLLPDSMLSIGLIQREGLKHYDQAADSFKSLIEKYPDSDETKQAYEFLANMYDEDMRNYANAINTYDTLVARYKTDPVVLRGLQALARIYQDKTHQPVLAIETYRKLAELFKDKDGLEALIKAEKLAFYTVKDWNLSIDINDRIIAMFPNNDESAVAMYANAGIFEEKLKQPEIAIKLYHELIYRYPRHELSKEAKRRSDALENKK